MGQYAATVAGERVFVYGDFSSKPAGPADLSPHPGRSPSFLEPPVAIEILREFGPRELIGKVYIQKGTSWVPVNPQSAASHFWYANFHRVKEVHFEMGGSGRWEVEWFRFESGVRDPNPYLAVALRQKVDEVNTVASSSLQPSG